MSDPAEARSRDRRRLAVLIGVFALLIQAFVPAAALAAQRSAGQETIVICTKMGVQTITVDDAGRNGDGGPAKGFAGLPCQNCLAVSIALLAPPDLTVAPLSYAVAEAEHAPATAEPTLRGARAPPRPPSRAPPIPNA